MIKFFRKIRYNLMEQNKTGKYLKYAIGEIILVVIGILIALSINNWNERQKSNIREQTVLENFIKNLNADLISYSLNRQQLIELNVLYKTLYEIGVKNRKDLIIENTNYIRRGIAYTTIAKDNDPFIANKINNEAINEKILTYFRSLKDIDDTFENFDIVIYAMRDFLKNNNINNLAGWFENQNSSNLGDFQYGQLIKEEDLIAISKIPEFQQLMLELSIKTTDFLLKIESIIEQNNELKVLIENSYK